MSSRNQLVLAPDILISAEDLQQRITDLAAQIDRARRNGIERCGGRKRADGHQEYEEAKTSGHGASTVALHLVRAQPRA